VKRRPLSGVWGIGSSVGKEKTAYDLRLAVQRAEVQRCLASRAAKGQVCTHRDETVDPEGI